MGKISELRVDPTAEEEGVWVEWALGIRLRIARDGNSRYSAKVAQIMEPHVERWRTRQMPADEEQRLVLPAVAEFLLTGWENVEDEAGEDLPYNVAVALIYLADPHYHDMLDFVVRESRRVRHYREKALQAALGNSQAGSSGPSAGAT